VDEPDIGDFTPLLDLVMTSWNWRWAPSPAVQLEVAKILLAAGANPDRPGGRDMLAPQREGLSPLMAAAHAKRFELATLLLEHSRTPASASKLGYNVIHLVFLDQNLQQFNMRLDDAARAFIELAASKGVDPAAPLGELGTLKDVAQRAGAIELAKFFGGLQG
jgi:ankyrin repeat protein